jgi:hypothetical protein
MPIADIGENTGKKPMVRIFGNFLGPFFLSFAFLPPGRTEKSSQQEGTKTNQQHPRIFLWIRRTFRMTGHGSKMERYWSSRARTRYRLTVLYLAKV